MGKPKIPQETTLTMESVEKLIQKYTNRIYDELRDIRFDTSKISNKPNKDELYAHICDIQANLECRINRLEVEFDEVLKTSLTNRFNYFQQQIIETLEEIKE